MHFLLIGALLFISYGLLNEGNETGLDDKNRIVISETDIKRLSAQWYKKWQRLPTKTELQGLIEHRIHEEVMYREALRMGFEHNDPVIRRRLAQKMEFISSDLAEQLEPSEAELSDYLQTHSERFELPARVSFKQIYLSIDKRGAKATADAQHLLQQLTQLKQSASVEEIKNLGDPIMLGQEHNELSPQGVSRVFGEEFAAKIFTLPVASWQGPIVSAYGVHVVFIDNKTSAKLPDLSVIHKEVSIEWLAEQQKKMDQVFYQGLRERYQIIISDKISKNITLSVN